MNEYPTEEELQKLQNWDVIKDLKGFIEYSESLWNMNYGVFEIWGDNLKLVTGGWSGNEDIINYLPSMFNMLYWKKSERGGLHLFDKIKF